LGQQGCLLVKLLDSLLEIHKDSRISEIHLLDCIGIGSPNPDIETATTDEICGKMKGFATGYRTHLTQGRLITGVGLWDKIATTSSWALVFFWLVST
jgi:hypothetical protein